MNRKTEFKIIVFSIIIIGLVASGIFIPQLTSFATDPNLIQFTLYPNHIVACTFKDTITAYQTDGSSSIVQTGTQFFYPNVYSIVNPATGKNIDHFMLQPQIACSNHGVNVDWNAQGLHPVLTGSYTLYSQIFQDSKSWLINTHDQDIGTINLVSGQYANLGPAITISASSMINALPNNGKAFAWDNRFVSVFYFTVPELSQNSNFDGALEIATLGLQTHENTVSQTTAPTTLFGCNNGASICTYPLSSYIHYTVTYADGTTSSGDSPNVVTPKLLDLFKQDGSNQVAISSITLQVMAKDKNNLGVSVSNAKINIKGTVQVGDHLPLALSNNDFSVTPVSDINFGLATIQVSPSAITSDIHNSFGAPVQNPQQTTISFQIDGTFNANYQGKTYNGVLSGLTWALSTMYGNLGSNGIGANTGGSQCAIPNTQSGINPNGLSPSSGQSFNCSNAESTCNDNGGNWDTSTQTCKYPDNGGQTTCNNSGGTWDVLTGSCTYPTGDTHTYVDNGTNTGLTGTNIGLTGTNIGKINTSNGVSGFCPNTTTIDQCIGQLLATNNSTTTKSSLFGLSTTELFIIGIVLFFFIFALILRRS